jgi:uncharacterized SAM-binding protein YcdF (DUF218 family)
LKKRLGVLILLLAVAIGSWQLATSLGHILYEEDSLQKADTIYVLAGARVARVAEAAELYREGWAPRILLSRQLSEAAEHRLRAAGIQIQTETELQRDVLRQMGVPPDAIEEVAAEHNATADEVEDLARIATQRQWQRIIVVTSKFHTARSALAMRRRFQPLGKEIIMRASRYDDANVDRWWSNRSDLRFVLWESQKLLVYWLGLAS